MGATTMEIKVPSFRIERNDDEGFSLGKLSAPLIVGFGIHVCWMSLIIFSSESLLFFNSASPSRTAALFSSVLLGFFVTMMFAYGVGSFLMRRLFATRHKRFLNRAIGAALAGGGTLLAVLADSSTVLGMALIWASGATTGIGSVVLLMSYGVSCAQCDVTSAFATTAMALVLGVIFYALLLKVATVLSGWTFAIAAAILPIECFCLYRSSSLLIDRLEFASLTLQVRKPAFAARICLVSLLLGFALGVLRASAAFEVFATGDDTLRAFSVLAGCLITFAFILLTIMTQRLNLNFLFRSLMLFVSLALLWYIFGELVGTALQSVGILAAYLLFECTVWVYFSDIAQRYRITPFIVFGFGSGALALGALLATLVTNAHGYALLTQPPVSTLVFAAMLIAYVMIPQEDTLRRMIINRDNSSVDLDNTACTNDLEADGIPGKAARAGWFKLKCVTIAKRHLLSQRETEILFLLAKGRNAAYIQERLYISEGTARTHMRHIYKKLDVHTQQNLIEMVDSVDLSFAE
jgi:DNA-binding CsgD family transcriptional regulator